MVAKSKMGAQSQFERPTSIRGKRGGVDPIAARMSEASAPLSSESMTLPSKDVVVGSFAERAQAQDAVRELRRVGFAEDEIGVIARESAVSAQPGVEGISENEAEGVAEGAVAGSLTGAGLAGLWAVGISVGALPAIGPAIAGGILASILTSAVAGAAVGGIVGSLVGLGLSEDDARHYALAFESGRTIVTVRAPGRAAEAGEILKRFGANTDLPSSQNMTDTGEPVPPMIWPMG